MRRYRRTMIFFGIFLLALCVSGCGKGSEKKAAESSTSSKSSEELDEITLEGMVSDALSSMTLKEKIGQLFIVSTDSLDFNGETEMTDVMKETLEAYRPGGVIFFSYNLESRAQTAKMVADMQATAKIPLFISVDEEGGSVARIANTEGMGTTKFPDMAEIGKTGDSEKAREVGETIGEEIGALGFNLDFAPVADISTNAENTEIGNRSFSSNEKTVSDMVAQEVKGLQSKGVSATLKHFPGQGDTGEDTHKGYVDLNTTIDHLRRVEFRPFKAGISAGVDLIMMSHVAVSQVTGTETPASLSSLMVSDILRDELQYESIIITDAMNMKVITKFYDADQAAVLALKAGNDMILMPDNFSQAFEGVYEAVKDGTLSEKRIDKSVSRILAVKIKRGILPSDSELFQKDTEK